MLQVSVNRRHLVIFTAVVALLVSVAWVSVASGASAGSSTPVVYVATGENFPDALGAGPAAAIVKGPILLVTLNAIPGETAAELTRLAPDKIIIVGGTAVVSASVETGLGAYAGTVERIAGANRYDTAAKLSAATYPAIVDADTLDGKDSTAFVQKGESDSVSATMRTNEPGIAFAFDAAGGTATTSLETFMSITIVAPTAGYIVVEGSVELELKSGDSGNYFISAVPNNLDATGPAGLRKGVSNSAPTLVYMIATEEKAYPINAGSHTYYMGLNGLSGVDWDDATLVATFYPTAYGVVSDL